MKDLALYMGFGRGCGTALAGLNPSGVFGSSGFRRAIPYSLGQNGTNHTVVQFHIQLVKHVGGEDTCFGNVPNGCGFCYALNDDFLMTHPWACIGTVGAVNRLHVDIASVGMAVVLGHFGGEDLRADLNFLND